MLTPASIDTLAVNVVDFGVLIYHRDTNANLVRDFPVSSAAHVYRTTTALGPPVVVDIFIRTLTDEGAAQLANLEAYPPLNKSFADTWWALVDAHSSVATRRVEINASN